MHQELPDTSVQNKPRAKMILAVHLDQTGGLPLEEEVWIQQSAECAHTLLFVSPLGMFKHFQLFHAAHGCSVCSP